MPDSPPGSGIPIIGPILQTLSSIFSNKEQVSDLANSVERVEEQSWTNLLSTAAFSFGLFGGILNTLGGLLRSLAKLLENIVGGVIFGFLKNLLRKVLDWITKLRNWIRVHIAAWQQIQRQLERQRALYLRKAIDILQRIRKILVPFRLLHLKFAETLDRRLVGIESELGQAWAKMIRHQNAVLGVLNAIIDPRQLLRPGHTLGSIGLMIGAVRGAVGALSLKDLLCLTEPVGAQPLTEPMATEITVVLGEIRAHSGDQAAIEAARDQTMQDIAFDWGVST